MTKSFVFKDQSGKAIGYMQQIHEGIRCRIKLSENQNECEVVVFHEDGTSSRHLLESDGLEHEWRDTSAGVLGACVMCQASRIADTGKAARQMLINSAENRTRRNTCPEKTEADPPTIKRLLVPQRRWPPHPCFQKAKYIAGKWVFDQKV